MNESRSNILEEVSNNSFVKALFYFILSLTFVLSAVFLSNLLEQKQQSIEPDATATTTPQNRPPLVACPANFLSYQELIRDNRSVVHLINEKTAMYAENGEFKSQVVITKIETEESKVACGYLSVRGGTETYGPLQSWENLYINPNSFGGHINPDTNIGPGDSKTSSEYVFPLSKIHYWKTRNDRVRGNLLTADWGVLLNVSETIGFEIGLNTLDKTGFIDKFSIAYKCWNPKTGEQNYDCSIQVIEE